VNRSLSHLLPRNCAQLVDGIAGMSGGISAITVFYPLNKIRESAQA
jgi:hypothetical protein